VENEQLARTYKYEKRKLEMSIAKNLEKDRINKKILALVDSERESPRPNYKYQRIIRRY